MVKTTTHPFNNEITIVRFEGKKTDNDPLDLYALTHTKSLITILTLKGEAYIESDDKTYTLTPGTILTITGFIELCNYVFPNNYVGYITIISTLFCNEILNDVKHLTPRSLIKKSRTNFESVTPEQIALLKEVNKRIINNIERIDHIWRRQIIINETRNLLMEIGEIFINDPDDDLLILRFTQLLHNNSHRREPIEFYADKLSLTSEQLAKKIKKSTGLTLSECINETLLRQAKLYLQEPEMSVQQVACLLNFSDQSAFGKFFKNQTGISPSQYQQDLARLS